MEIPYDEIFNAEWTEASFSNYKEKKLQLSNNYRVYISPGKNSDLKPFCYNNVDDVRYVYIGITKPDGSFFGADFLEDNKVLVFSNKVLIPCPDMKTALDILFHLPCEPMYSKEGLDFVNSQEYTKKISGYEVKPLHLFSKRPRPYKKGPMPPGPWK